MKIAIAGREYSVSALNKASLSDLLALKRASGLALKDVQAGFERLQAFAEDESLSPTDRAMEIISDESVLLALGAMIFIARWKAGEKLGFEEACDFPFDELDILAEPADEVEPAEVADPS